MASLNPQKSNQNQDCGSENEVIKKIDLSFEQLRREFHRSLDLNHTIIDADPLELFNQSHICYNINTVEGECAMQGGGLDLNLSLTPPGLNSPKDESSSNQSEISSSSSSAAAAAAASPSSSQRSCMSIDLIDHHDIEELNEESSNREDDHDHLASLILMGCTQCIMYVMVSEADPKCPKCQSSVLLDLFREKPPKRSRIN